MRWAMASASAATTSRSWAINGATSCPGAQPARRAMKKLAGKRGSVPMWVGRAHGARAAQRDEVLGRRPKRRNTTLHFFARASESASGKGGAGGAIRFSPPHLPLVLFVPFVPSTVSPRPQRQNNRAPIKQLKAQQAIQLPGRLISLINRQ